MGAIFHTIIYQPLYNVVVFLCNVVPLHDFGIAIILATALIKLALYPISQKQIESQKKMQDVQPKLKAIQEKYKDNKEKQTKAVMEFYKDNKISPFSGCLPLIAQLVFLIAFYRILMEISTAGLVIDGNELYSFISRPEKINHLFIGLVDLSKPNVLLAICAAIAQYWQTKMLIGNKPEVAEGKKNGTGDMEDVAQMMSKQMMYLGPILTFVIGIKFPAGMALYWLASTLFAVFQQRQILKKEKQN